MENYIAVTEENWIKIVEYIEDTKPSFYKSNKAVEIQKIFTTAKKVNIAPEKEPIKEAK